MLFMMSTGTTQISSFTSEDKRAQFESKGEDCCKTFGHFIRLHTNIDYIYVLLNKITAESPSLLKHFNILYEFSPFQTTKLLTEALIFMCSVPHRA
ncbi:hypothetical protein HanHA89_Chr15g0627261 [Helianthus annuus]|nr:hypothetical protein HanHA89_Chr15g0627261 [Helianthus annuus]